jgi:membrane protein YqaA with SNARE-associated domain
MDWTLNLANTPYAVWSLFGVAFAESSFFPIPPDLLQIALSVSDPSQSFVYASVALVGSVTGAMAGYGLGLWGGRPLVMRVLKEPRMRMVEDFYNRYDVWAIAIAGFTPIPYKVFAVSGGAFKINFWRFVLVSVFARGARFFIVATAMYFFGEKVKDVILHNVNLAGIIFVVLLVGGFAVISWFGKKR